MEETFTVAPLLPEHLPLAYAWNGGDSDGCPFDRYVQWVTQPHWLNFVILKRGLPVACVMLERRDAVTVRCHLAVERHAIPVRTLCSLLDELGEVLFTRGFHLIEAVIPASNRAACLLAVLSHLTPAPCDEPGMRRFTISAVEYFFPDQPYAIQTQTLPDAVCAEHDQHVRLAVAPGQRPECAGV